MIGGLPLWRGWGLRCSSRWLTRGWRFWTSVSASHRVDLALQNVAVVPAIATGAASEMLRIGRIRLLGSLDGVEGVAHVTSCLTGTHCICRACDFLPHRIALWVLDIVLLVSRGRIGRRLSVTSWHAEVSCWRSQYRHKDGFIMVLI